MAPAVPKAAQMRRPVSAVGVQDGRHFRDFLTMETGLDHHLAGKLHPRRGQTQAIVRILAESPQAAVGVADARAEVRITGDNVLPVAQKSAQYYSRQRYRQRYRRLGYHRSPYGGLIRRRGPYVQELGPGGRPTGPIGREANP